MVTITRRPKKASKRSNSLVYVVVAGLLLLQAMGFLVFFSSDGKGQQKASPISNQLDSSKKGGLKKPTPSSEHQEMDHVDHDAPRDDDDTADADSEEKPNVKSDDHPHHEELKEEGGQYSSAQEKGSDPVTDSKKGAVKATEHPTEDEHKLSLDHQEEHVDQQEQQPDKDDGAYYADYAYERENPSFRHNSVPDWRQHTDSQSAQSCRYLSDDHSLLFHSAKCTTSTKLIAYNGASFPRLWCGKTISPQTSVELEDCDMDEPVNLFDLSDTTSIPLDGHDMPAIVIRGRQDAKQKTKSVDCTIPCEFDVRIRGYERFVEGTNWKVHFTMNDPVKHDEAKVEPTAFRQDLYYATTSFRASVPQSFFSFDTYDIFAPAKKYEDLEKSGSYIVDTQCSSHYTKRNRWADAVKNKTDTKFYGKCGHDTDGETDTMEHRLNIMSKHLFNLAFEFGDAKDHITPLVWESVASGVLPVLIGASNLNDHLPFGSYVSTAGLQHWDDLGNLVKEVAFDKAKWESYHKYRSDPKLKAAFEKRYNFTRVSPECRLCKWAYAKKYGLGWSHEQQEIRPTAIDRQLHVDGKKFITKPFVEEWMSGQTSLAKADESANKAAATTSKVMVDNMVERSIHFHDQIYDIYFQKFSEKAPDKDLILRLHFPVENLEGAHFPNPHAIVDTSRGAVATSIAIQDAHSKVFVITNWPTSIVCVQEGVVDITVRREAEILLHGEDEQRQLRVIVEDMVELYDKATEFYPTTFAKQMVQDFVDPLELYFIDSE